MAKRAVDECGQAAKSDTEWLAALRNSGRSQESALAALRSKLLAGLAAYLNKTHVVRGTLDADEAQHLAEDCTQEAILTIRKKLDSFRGESRFTTWAFAIAIRIALGELRRRRWRQASIDQARLGVDLPAWPVASAGPERSLEQREAWAILARLIDTELTPRQRNALVAHVFQEMPLDLVAEWLGSNRNSLYKLIHDARKRLKQALLEHGITHADLIALFDQPGRGPEVRAFPLDTSHSRLHRKPG